MPRATIKIKRDGWPNNAGMILEIPPGDAGVPVTLAAMREIVIDAIASPSVQRFAYRTLGDQGGGTMSTARALYHQLVQWFNFQKDPNAVELLRTPEQVIVNILNDGQHQGDCDELAIFGCTMLKVFKVPCSFVAMSDRPGRNLHHVFYAVGQGDKQHLIPFDPQERTPPGQWPNHDRMVTLAV